MSVNDSLMLRSQLTYAFVIHLCVIMAIVFIIMYVDALGGQRYQPLRGLQAHLVVRISIWVLRQNWCEILTAGPSLQSYV